MIGGFRSFRSFLLAVATDAPLAVVSEGRLSCISPSKRGVELHCPPRLAIGGMSGVLQSHHLGPSFQKLALQET
jgi:hypothetical protein